MLVCAGLLWARPAAAQAHPLQRFGCHTAPTGENEQRHLSPLHDRQAIEFHDFSRAKRIVGNEPVKYHYIAFTFDDGPSYVTTPKVLDALDKYDIPATFFIVGQRIIGDKPDIRRNQAVLREEIRRGHLIGNHTLTHPDLKHISQARLRHEIERTSDALTKFLGYRPYLFRPPYGNVNNRVRNYLIANDYIEVRWTTDSSDYKIHNEKTLVNRTLRSIQWWKRGVVLFHDTKPHTAHVIGHFFARLERLNCRRYRQKKPMFIPVSLHYFTFKRNPRFPGRKDMGLRKIPPAVKARTKRYIRKLTNRCKTRLSHKKT